ncbi:MAG: thioesterase family protein [Stackebrandtia sp.]
MSELTATDVAGRVESTVAQIDTAQAQGSGDVPVLGTPRVLALAEAACVSALTRRIPTNLTTVGVRVDLRHTRAVPLGHDVTATSVLKRRDGRRLVFAVTVADSGGAEVATGEIERVIVDREEFLADANKATRTR